MSLWARLMRWWLNRPRVCPECKLLACEARDVECRCDWLL
jgi:hypothetical protein